VSRGGRLPAPLRELRRAVAWHRRLLAAGLAAGAVALGLSAVSPEPAETVPVLTAARGLLPGAPLAEADLAAVGLPPGAVPDGALRPGAEVLGRLLAGPVRRGEPLTDVRLVGPGLLDGLGRGVRATPVRIADGGAVALLRPGDRVDVLATRAGTDGPAAAVPVARDVPVLSVPADEGAVLADGALLVLATDADTARELAAATLDGRLSVVLRSA
jgi:Flp pilus assembly protein CpaB